MPDRVTEKRARFALADLEAGRYQAVAAFLAKLGGVPEPELLAPEAPKRRKARRVAPPAPVVSAQLREDYDAVAYAQLCEQRAREPVTPLPKPSKRIVARDVVAEFRAQNTRCCVLSCGQSPADPHHIWPRGRGGPDETGNLMPLCRQHHALIENIDAEEFAARYASRLPASVLLKMKLAMMMEADKKLADRPAIDLDDPEDAHA